MARCYGLSLLLLLPMLNAGAQTAFSITDKKLTNTPLAVPTFSKQAFIPSSTIQPQPIQPVANNFYTQHLPFFCKQELKMEQAHIPLHFRVGSFDDCNWLEKKPGYSYRP